MRPDYKAANCVQNGRRVAASVAWLHTPVLVGCQMKSAASEYDTASVDSTGISFFSLTKNKLPITKGFISQRLL